MLIIQRPTVEPVGEEDANRQRFGVGPLEPGFGYTLGNSLRRTLLSSIPGAAISSVRNFMLAEQEGFEPLVGLVSGMRLLRTAWKRCSRVPQDTPATLRRQPQG